MISGGDHLAYRTHTRRSRRVGSRFPRRMYSEEAFAAIVMLPPWSTACLNGHPRSSRFRRVRMKPMRLKDRGQICSCMAGAFVNWRTVCGGHAKSTMRSRWNHSTKKHCIASVHRSQFDALRQSDLGQITFERASWKAIGDRSTILLSLRSSEEHEAITSRDAVKMYSRENTAALQHIECIHTTRRNGHRQEDPN